jgi:hypothetical protein
MSSYWVVSPNISPSKPGSLAKWKQIILRSRFAIMGWGPDHKIGRRFAKKVMADDVILIARRHNHKPEIVGFGVVQGKAEPGAIQGRRIQTIRGLVAPEHFGYFRRLSPFVRCSKSPEQVHLIDSLAHTMALAKLHPDRRRAHKLLCDWMDQSLRRRNKSRKANIQSTRSRSRKGPRSGAVVVDIPKSRSFGYVFSPKRATIRARKEEANLVEGYRRWVWRKHRRKLRAIRAHGLVCDCYEEERRNVVEAKSSVRREDIRMAVGQLLDYAHQFEQDFGHLNTGILLPRKPKPASVNWLPQHKVSIIWRERSDFKDNAAGSFT